MDRAHTYFKMSSNQCCSLFSLPTGVADVDGLHLVVDGNMNGIAPRVPGDPDRMRRPDSLAVRGHEYEELPASR